MSAYSDGIEALAGCHVGANVRPLVYAAARIGEHAARVGDLPLLSTPAAMQARAEQLLGEVARTDEMIGRYAPPPAAAAAFLAWRTQWAAFAAQFRAYVAQINWFDRLWGSTAEQIETYAAQIGVWQSQFRDFGGYMPGVAPPAAWSWVKQVAIGVGVGLTVSGILWLLRSSAPRAPVPVVAVVAQPEAAHG